MSEFGLDVLLIDGGSSWNNNMVSAIHECLKLDGITSLDQVIVDVMSLDSSYLDPYDPYSDAIDQMSNEVNEMYLETQTMKNYFRKKAINSYYNSLDDIIEFMDTFPEVTYRYFIMADSPLMHEYSILDFQPEVAKKLIERGKVDALKTISLGEGTSFNTLRSKGRRK